MTVDLNYERSQQLLLMKDFFLRLIVVLKGGEPWLDHGQEPNLNRKKTISKKIFIDFGNQ